MTSISKLPNTNNCHGKELSDPNDIISAFAMPFQDAYINSSINHKINDELSDCVPSFPHFIICDRNALLTLKQMIQSFNSFPFGISYFL